MVIVNCRPHDLPAVSGNRLYLDYISGAGAARQFFMHAPTDLAGAYRRRRRDVYPRRLVVDRLKTYQQELHAGRRALQNVEDLARPDTFCVVTGQQAGFLGGPAYTTFKIVTAIRWCERLQGMFGGRFVPIFWLATEDHDLAEINHTYFLRPDGKVGRVKFGWQDEGCPISRLPVTREVRKAYAGYFQSLTPGPGWEQARALFAAGDDEWFALWQARFWSQLFSAQGLVVVEPRILRQPACDFLVSTLEQAGEIRRRLVEVAQRLERAGYAPALDPRLNGGLFTFDRRGRRVRVDDPAAHIDLCAAHPDRYSTDAALRPLMADLVLPTLVSVLGPGEIAYQGMLKPLYELFDLAQPVLAPRKSYTVLGRSDAEALSRYGSGVEAILSESLDFDAVFRRLVPAPDLQMFSTARAGVEAALAPLEAYLTAIDPNLGRTWEQTVAYALRNVTKLEKKALKARMSQLGFSRRQLGALCNGIYPRGRLQERVFPLPHFINRFGLAFVDRLDEAGELDDFSHHVLVMEDGDG